MKRTIDLERTYSSKEIWEISFTIRGGHKKRANFRRDLQYMNNELIKKQVDKIDRLYWHARNEHRWKDMRNLSLVRSRWSRKILKEF